jgi:hypothetical protein
MVPVVRVPLELFGVAEDSTHLQGLPMNKEIFKC